MEKKKKSSLLQTQEGETLLKKLLKENGFEPKKPDIRIAWHAFKQLGEYQFDCSEEGLLFEAGMIGEGEEKQFCLSMVRQFTIEVEEEYDYMEQLHMDFFYSPEAALEKMKQVVWTYEFDGDFQSFFEAVGRLPIFNILQESYAPLGFELYQEEI